MYDIAKIRSVTAHVPVELAKRADEIAVRLKRSRSWIVKRPCESPPVLSTMSDHFWLFHDLDRVSVLYATTNEIAGSMSATFNTLMNKAPKALKAR